MLVHEMNEKEVDIFEMAKNSREGISTETEIVVTICLPSIIE